MELKIKPLSDRVIVEPVKGNEKTKSGIIIPETARERPSRGVVLSVGPGSKDSPITVKEGDSVLYGKHSGTDIEVDGLDYLIMRESDILAII